MNPEPARTAPSSHGSCRHCAAWVVVKAAHCPICGIAGPLQKWRIRLMSLGPGAELCAFAGIGLGMATAGVASFALAAVGWSSPVLSACAIAAAALIGSRVGRAYGPRWLEHSVDAKRPRSVLAVRDDLHRRIATLNASGLRIAALRAQLSAELPAEQAVGALDVLDAAAQASVRHHERLATELWRVTLVQWQNQLQPALATWRSLGDRQAEQELARLDRARTDLQRTCDDWQRQPLAATDAGKQVLAQANKLDRACESLKRALLLRQAVAIAQGAPGIADAYDRRTIPAEVLDQLDVLRERAELGDYLKSPTDATDEAERLRAQTEAVVEIERILSAPAKT